MKLADCFGFAGKTLSAFIVTVVFGDQDRSFITVVPLTTSLHLLGEDPPSASDSVLGV